MRIKNKKLKRHTKGIISLCVVLLLLVASFYALAEEADVSPNLPLGASSFPMGSSGGLGESGTLAEKFNKGTLQITSEEEFLDFVNQVAEGNSYAGWNIQIMEDISLSTEDKWSPIGSEKTPFSGYFHGNGNRVSLPDIAIRIPLFGYLKNAVIENVTVVIPTEGETPSEMTRMGHRMEDWLYQSAENTTIITCLRAVRAPELIMYFGDVIPNANWLTSQSVPGVYELSTMEDLAALAVEVNINGKDFSSEKVVLKNDIVFDEAVSGNRWPYIGTPNYPFKGHFDGQGHSIKNLTHTEGLERAGFFGVVRDSVLENVSILDVNISGTDVGALAYQVVNSDVRHCNSSGKLTGYNVGGLINRVEILPAPGEEHSVEWCYSTATIDGNYGGGLIHTFLASSLEATATYDVSNCFFGGQIYGTDVSGLIGTVYLPYSYTLARPMFYLENNAVYGTSYALNSSGIALLSHDSWGVPEDVGMFARNCYSAFNFYGKSKTQQETAQPIFGHEAPAMGWDYILAEDSYFSGEVKKEGILYDGEVFPPEVSRSSYSLENLYFDPNSVYSPANYRNIDTSHPENYYKYNYTGDTQIKEVKFFDEEPNTPISSGFTPSTVVYTDLYGNGQQYATEGNFPKLVSFEDVSAPQAFKDFSEISTNVSLRNTAHTLYRSNSGMLTEDPNKSEAYYFSNIKGATWSFENNEMTMVIPDLFSESGENHISMKLSSNGRYYLEAENSISEPFDIIVQSHFPSISGLSTDHTITIEADSLQTNNKQRGGMPEEFFSTLSELQQSSLTLPEHQRVHLLRFPVIIEVVPNVKVDLIEFVDGNVADIKTYPDAISFSQVNDKSVTLSIDPTVSLHADSSYKISITRDKAPVVSDWASWQQELYFQPSFRQDVELLFDKNYIFAKADAGGSTTPNLKEQKVYMEENSPFFVSYQDGLVVRNSVSMDLNKYLKTTIRWTNTAAGHGPYTGDLATPTLENFHKIPGTYILEYQLTDQISQNTPITRTYHVSGKPKLLQGGKAIPDLKLTLSLADIEALSANKTLTDQNIEEAILTYLSKKYLETPGENQITMTSYDEKGTPQSYKIIFDPLGVSAEFLTNASTNVFSFHIEGMPKVYSYTLTVEGLVPDIMLRVENVTYEVINEYSKADAKAHWNAFAVKISDPSVLTEDSLIYDFSRVKNDVVDIPQPVTIQIAKYVDSPSDLVRENTSVEVTVLIRKKTLYTEKDSAEQVAQEFWENKNDIIRKAESNRTFRFAVKPSYLKWVPADFFLVVANNPNTTVILELPNGIEMKVTTDTVDKTRIEYDRTRYNLSFHSLESLALKNKMAGEPFLAFYTEEQMELPGTMEITVPASKNFMPNTLYTSDIGFNSSHEESQLKTSTGQKVRFVLDKYEEVYVLKDTE